MTIKAGTKIPEAFLYVSTFLMSENGILDRMP